jgi:hypothetical protein
MDTSKWLCPEDWQVSLLDMIPKHLRKLRLKQARAYEAIARGEGKDVATVFCARDEPSPLLYVGGAGASCNISDDQLLEVFSAFGQVVHILLPPMRPYAIILFAAADMAASARCALHCQSTPQLDNRNIFIEYAQENVLESWQSHPGIDCLNAASFLSLSSPFRLSLENLASFSWHPEAWVSHPSGVPGLVIIPDFVSAQVPAQTPSLLTPCNFERPSSICAVRMSSNCSRSSMLRLGNITNFAAFSTTAFSSTTPLTVSTHRCLHARRDPRGAVRASRSHSRCLAAPRPAWASFPLPLTGCWNGFNARYLPLASATSCGEPTALALAVSWSHRSLRLQQQTLDAGQTSAASRPTS